MIGLEGYGRGEASNGDISVFVEIRSSVHRSKEIQIRLPQSYLSLERRLKQRISDRIFRGKLDVFIKRTSLHNQQEVLLDMELAQACFEQMTHMATVLKRAPTEVDINQLFNQPGILNTMPKEPDAMQEWIIVSTALDAALIDLIQQRKVRGKELKMEIEPELRGLQQHRGELFAQLESLNQALLERLSQRLNKLLGQRIPEHRLQQEAALLIEKSDISEELKRLEDHCLALGQLQSQKEKGIGRKMDLIAQEIMREMNTLASKVIPAEANHHIIEMKMHMEQIRDIVAQIE